MNSPSFAVAGTTVAVLGTGTMGAPIARNLLHAGMPVRVWNRTPAKTEELAADGALVAISPAAAAADVDVLITMLTDGAAVEQVMTGPHGALSTLGPDAVWVQMSTVGIEWSDRLAHLAARHGVAFVDAPVSGSTQPAENGQLVILAAAAPSARPRLEPIFEPLARQILWLGRVGDSRVLDGVGQRVEKARDRQLGDRCGVPLGPRPEPSSDGRARTCQGLGCCSSGFALLRIRSRAKPRRQHGLIGLTVAGLRAGAFRWAARLPLIAMLVGIGAGDQGGSIVLGVAWLVIALLIPAEQGGYLRKPRLKNV